MKLYEWKAKNKSRRNYAHFDNRVSLDDVWGYINNPKNIETHSFYPFIHYIQTFNKYSKEKGIIKKERELCYSAHIDRCIFQFYGYKLNQLYNKRAENDGISNSAIAYRDELRKNNIHFAKQAIDFIRKKESCYIIIGDFTKFFDSLDHKYLKNMLNDLLGTKELPADYYAVYKNITKYSVWDLESLLDLNGLPHSEDGIKKLNQLEKVLTLDQFKLYKKQYVKKHEEDYGIPQGSAISAVLSNIYMLQFDKRINDYVCDNNGLYMRYSDDFIIVLPKRSEEVFKNQFTYINSIIKSIPRLDLQPDKTQIFEFKDNFVISCNELVLDRVNNGKNLLNYLGFTFDGNVVTIRDKTISKYYYRMYRKLKTIIKSNGVTKKGNKISCKNIYEKYSIKGIYKGKGNFISYVKRAEMIFGKGEAINRATKKHMRKIRQKLDLIK
ncbi:MAG: reverse transcriptase/maturase family protein [Clostridiales bacterium]|nr:reverse transcriptase/maturase family protein [Eubacteriales bacterium]MDH7567658.1 reverse transcriptase/maturase family protein [Clostridiales bacterium]